MGGPKLLLLDEPSVQWRATRHLRTVVSVPLFVGERVFGVLSIGDTVNFEETPLVKEWALVYYQSVTRVLSQSLR